MDRLASLLPALRIADLAASRPAGGNLWLVQGGDGLALALGSLAPPDTVAGMTVDWGAGLAALTAAGPARMALPPGEAMAQLADLLLAELAAPRCGREPLLKAYAQALVVHLLRGLIADHQAEVGLLAGLADPRLAPALTAIHDSPETDWRVEDLAARAGMSRSAFMAHFRQVMRDTPIGYLRRWRLDHARQALAGGLRVGSVARRYGYASPEAFSRAFRAAEGIAPRDLRPNRQV